MKKKIIALILLLIVVYFSMNYFIKNDQLKSIRDLFSQNQKDLIKKYIFPWGTLEKQKKIIINHEKKIKYLEPIVSELVKFLPLMELEYKKSLKDIETKKMPDMELGNGYTLARHKIIGGFYAGINNNFPGSGYMDFHSDNLLILSSLGILGYSKNISDKIIFKQIKNNINEFIGLEQFNKKVWYSLKDLTIHNNQIFISYTEEIKTDCWNTSVIFAEMNYENIIFKKLFSSKSHKNSECIHAFNNVDKEYNAHQSGGRIVGYDNNNILLTVGEYRNRYLAQDKKSINGKILKININNSDYEVISMGHRNPQGLYYDKENNFLLETEHGPLGGDEINLIELENLNNKEIPNYGWAISSAGEFWGWDALWDYEKKIKKKKYPLHKSHKKYGFIEPLKSFVPAPGLSEITKIKNNLYVLSSLKHRSLYFFELDKQNKIINFTREIVSERVRDIIYRDNKLYLFLEDTATIGILSVN